VSFHEFGGLTSVGAREIAAGLDGNLWFTETGADRIGEINPTTHVVHQFDLTAGSNPIGITAGPDGNLWFTENGTNRIGSINPATDVISEYGGLHGGLLFGITAGPDGNIWFTEQSGAIGEIDRTTHAISEFPVTAGSGPTDITTWDGNLWFTESAQIGEIDPTTHVVSQFPLLPGDSYAYGITAGQDGNLWFAQYSTIGHSIGEIDPMTHVVNEFGFNAVVSPWAAAPVHNITAGPDGNLWFTFYANDQIVSFNPTTINPTTHVIDVGDNFTLPTLGSQPFGITEGPDGNLWFAELGGNRIGQVVLPAPPTVLTVTNTRDDGSWGSLRAAITQANTDAANGTSDTISFDSSLAGSTIVLTRQLDLSGAGTGKITIDGSALATPITIRGNNWTRVFKVDSGVTATFDGLIIADGQPAQPLPGYPSAAANGGGIYNAGTLTVLNSTLSGNSALNDGGGIYNYKGTLRVENCKLSGNWASGSYDAGGGIYNYAGSLTVQNSTLVGNSARGYYGNGGAIANIFGTVTLTSSTLSGNSALQNSGAISNFGTLTISNSTFSNNFNGQFDSASGQFDAGSGGAIFNAGKLTVSSSTFSGNSSPNNEGGAIANNGTLTLSNSTFSGNSAYGGGAISDGGTSTVSNSSFSGNTALYGGGIYFFSQNSVLTNVTIAANQSRTGGQGGGIWADPSSKIPLALNNTIVATNVNGTTPDDIAGTINTTSSYNLIGTGGSGGLQNGANGNQVGVANPGLAPLGDNGGPTWTTALQPGSPAIGAGSVPLAVDANGKPLLTDQRGFGFLRTVNGKIDIGAYESQTVLSPRDYLETVVGGTLPLDSSGNPSAVLSLDTQSQADAVMGIFASSNTHPLTVPTGSATPIDISVSLANGIQLNEAKLSIPSGFRVSINGGTWIGGSPALTLNAGNLTVTNATFQNATDAPTILVTGGSLTLRNDIVQESTGYNDAAIQVTGGTLDLGSATDPGGNVLNINGAGVFIANSTPNQIAASGDTFENNGIAFPATLAVTNTLDDGSPGSLRYEIASANAEAALGVPLVPINFDATLAGATIVLTQGQLELSGAGGGLITIDGSSLTSPITISGNNASRVFLVDSRVRAEFDNLTITGGMVVQDNGGGIANFGTLTVSRCTISANSAFYGGAIYNHYRAMVTVSGSILSRNSAIQGGGVYNDSQGVMIVTGSSIENNSARSDGGGICNLGQGEISGCSIAVNAAFAGGGIENLGSLSLSSCNLIGNSAQNPYGGTGDEDVDGGGILNYRTLTVSNSSFIGNRAVTGGAIWNSGTIVSLSGCSLFDNIAYVGTVVVPSVIAGRYYYYLVGGLGGAIYNAGPGSYPTATIQSLSGCTLSGNSVIGPTNGVHWSDPIASGGGIYNAGVLTINKASSKGVYNAETFDVNSAVFGNQAPTGADIENFGTLDIIDSAFSTLDNGGPVPPTISVAATDTATVVTDAVDPSVPGQVTFNVQVLAAQAGTPTPTGTVTLYDGNNNVLAWYTISTDALTQGTATLYDGNNNVMGTATLDANGQASFTAPTILGSSPPLHAVYSGDGNFTGSTSAPLIQAVNALSPANVGVLEDALAFAQTGNPQPNPVVALDATDTASAQAAANTVATLQAPIRYGAVISVTVVLRLAQGTYHDLTLSTQDNVTLVVVGGGHVGTVNGSTVVGDSPAVFVSGGNVILANLSIATATDAPTILVTGGHVTLRNDIVQESPGYNDAAIKVTSGALDLGTASNPGGNTLNVNGAGILIQNSGAALVSAIGNTFLVNSTTVAPLTAVALTSSVNPALPNQPITLTATVAASAAGAGTPTGVVTFVDTTSGSTLGTISLSGGTAKLTTSTLSLGTRNILVVYSGDANFVSSYSTLVQNVHYGFSGFLAPLNSNLAFGLGRTVPIKFQLPSYTGYVSSLSAVTSLQILNSLGTDVLAGTGKTALRYDPSANQFVANWQTKGLPAGMYMVTLVLADGTTYTKSVQLSTNGSGAALLVDGTSAATTATGALLGGNIELYVDNSNGDLTPDELARIQDAVTAVDAVTERYGVAVEVVTDPSQADVTLNMGTTSAVGSYANGVLGCTTDAGQLTIISGWNFYAGSDATQIGSTQYDFQTVVTHELGHALGLGHSADSTSVMYATLNTGTVNRILTTIDLNVPDTDAGACGLHAVPSYLTSTGQPIAPTLVSIQPTTVLLAFPPSESSGAMPSTEACDLLFTLLGAERYQPNVANLFANDVSSSLGHDPQLSGGVTDAGQDPSVSSKAKEGNQLQTFGVGDDHSANLNSEFAQQDLL
jgi:streptogramin lyase